jgi:hypothetical protein
MSDETETPKPRKPPLVFPPNSRDTTAENAGTIIGIVGAEHLRPRGTKNKLDQESGDA